jgi:hypothetical protein
MIVMGTVLSNYDSKNKITLCLLTGCKKYYLGDGEKKENELKLERYT